MAEPFFMKKSSLPDGKESGIQPMRELAPSRILEEKHQRSLLSNASATCSVSRCIRVRLILEQTNLWRN
ncbi:hypothetical protein OPV22_001857 [Ensete ventricosum]|uniref:Uncharacterized protein n=1 Tax=Ensete ventricosum TaxID=4639 RepID=A0AAV8RWH3_ENSVE|nr:hypothetical protein OPV22_001857 [Ensete ventricosum]